MRKYYTRLHDKNLNNLGEMDTFLERHKITLRKNFQLCRKGLSTGPKTIQERSYPQTRLRQERK